MNEHWPQDLKKENLDLTNLVKNWWVNNLESLSA